MKWERRIRFWCEYLPAIVLLKSLGFLPRPVARRVGILVGLMIFCSWGRLRRVGLRNLEMAFPEMSQSARRRVLRGTFRNLGRSLAEFSHFPKLNPVNIQELVQYEGLEHFLEALSAGRGVIILTAHFGAWELSSFAHALYGYPMCVLARPLDNPLLDRLVQRYRSLSGNRVIEKGEAARGVFRALKRGEAAGILVDLNTQPHEGIFCNFFGIPASTSPIIATMALRTGAPVVPGFLIWDDEQAKYRLKFAPRIVLDVTGDESQDVKTNTEQMNRIIEDMIRQYPDQWVWVHKRWHTRPDGQPDLYSRKPGRAG